METNTALPYDIFRVVWVSKTSPLQENNIISYPYSDWWNKLLLTYSIVADFLFSKNNSVSHHHKKIMGQSYRKPHCKVNFNFRYMILYLYRDNFLHLFDLQNWCILIDLQKAFDRSENYPNLRNDEHGGYCDVTSQSLSNNKSKHHFLHSSKKYTTNIMKTVSGEYPQPITSKIATTTYNEIIQALQVTVFILLAHLQRAQKSEHQFNAMKDRLLLIPLG